MRYVSLHPGVSHIGSCCVVSHGIALYFEGGVNHSAVGNNTHRTTTTWLAQAQYFFIDITTGESKCVGGNIVAARVGDLVASTIAFTNDGSAELVIRAGDATSKLVVSHPQLNPVYEWRSYTETSALRPYVSFEAWDASSNDASLYPVHPWDVAVFLEPSAGQPAFHAAPQWPRSTGMNVTSVPAAPPDALSARWTYAP